MNTINIGLSGLEAATKRLQASASNIANFTTTGSLEEGQQAPFIPITTTQRAQLVGGDVSGVRSDFRPIDQPFVPTFDPDSPFANEDGLIGVPNIDLSTEIVNLNLAELSYKASIATIKAADENAQELLNIFDDD